MMYERFSLYVCAETLVRMRDLFWSHRDEWLKDNVKNSELIQIANELEARVQHLPQGIEKPVKAEEPTGDWLA